MPSPANRAHPAAVRVLAIFDDDADGAADAPLPVDRDPPAPRDDPAPDPADADEAPAPTAA